jgi:hypothetical protein
MRPRDFRTQKSREHVAMRLESQRVFTYPYGSSILFVPEETLQAIIVWMAFSSAD